VAAEVLQLIAQTVACGVPVAQAFMAAVVRAGGDVSAQIVNRFGGAAAQVA
jgi:hypothetical protein